MDKKEIMMIALAEARLAAQAGDVPVGAVIVRDGEIVARAHNERETSHDATAHAEILAIRRASERLGRWRLSDCEMYVTLEPCPMCSGAILNARLGRVYFALRDANAGSFGSVMNMNSYPLLYKVETEMGLGAEESRELLSEFFGRRR